MAAKENLMGKSFTQTPGWLQSLAIAVTAEEDLGIVQNSKHRILVSCTYSLTYSCMDCRQCPELVIYTKSGKYK